jgi:hypothetical protein
MTANRRGIRLNLASQPVRNRRLFRLSLVALAAGIVLAFAAGAWLFGRVQTRLGRVRSDLARLERLESEARADIRKYDLDDVKSVQTSKAVVDRINDLIERKAFSWVDFLTQLEDALPGPSSILSFSPLSTEKANMEVRFKVASTDLDELVRFIQALEQRGFGPIRVMSQARGDSGDLVSDIVVGYERRK